MLLNSVYVSIRYRICHAILGQQPLKCCLDVSSVVLPFQSNRTFMVLK